MTDTHATVWDLISRLNKAWTSGAGAEELRGFFHPQVIALVSTEKRKIKGIETCAEHWNACFLNKEIQLWTERNQEIELFEDGKVAVVSYEFEIHFRREGEDIQAIGRDLFTLVYENDAWLIVAAVV